MPHTRAIAEDWYHLSFDDLYPIIYAHRTVDTAHRETEFSVRETSITQRDAVLDLCCGTGRHLAHLIHHSGRVTGLDYSSHLLELAGETLGECVALVRADMRHIPFAAAFDVVLNFFTSFGYFASRDENVDVIREIAGALRPGGRFFIDHINRAWAEENLKSASARTVEGFAIEERRWIDDANHRVNKLTIVSRDGREVNRKGESVQMYTPQEFKDLLAEGGLAVEKIYGDYTGAAIDAAHPRMIAVGKRV